MNLGSIGKALANQAMENTKNTVLDAVRTPDPQALRGRVADAATDTPTSLSPELTE